MPISAMPDHLNSQEEIDAAFPDDSQYGNSWFGRLYRAYQKKTKTWFAFSYRCTEPWARWRKFPKVLFAIKSKDGVWRVETDHVENGPTDSAYDARTIFNEGLWHVETGSKYDIYSVGYLSRIQYWCRWHFAIQWPLMVSFHWYKSPIDVPKYREDKQTDGKLWFAYWNHFDADLVYWMITSGYIGKNWK